MLLSGREVDGREITVQFAKYGPNAEEGSSRSLPGPEADLEAAVLDELGKRV